MEELSAAQWLPLLWKFLTPTIQGMAASPSICQMYVAACLDPLRCKFSSFHIVHYIDDILLAAPTKEKSLLMFSELQTLLEGHGFMQPPYSYLGFQIQSIRLQPQRLQLDCSHLRTLHDWQRLLGDVQWIRSSLSIPTGGLKPFMTCCLGALPLPPPGS